MVDKHGRSMNQTAAAKAQTFALASLRDAKDALDYGRIDHMAYVEVRAAFRAVVLIAQQYAP